jgi:energy-coupling factor transport system ATP-binding protein
MSNIEVSGVRFSYNETEEILRNINLSFDYRATAIIGQNGSGKTTFVKLLKGLLKPTSGNIFINGINTKEVSVAALARHIGLVFQNPNDQIFKSKVIDEVMFGPINIKKSEACARKNSLDALEAVGLSNKINENPYDLSLSERKLISIASVIAMDTKIIIFDEPTIAQDYSGKEIIKKLIKALQKQNKLIITIIHDMDFAAEVYERIVVFKEGEVFMDGSAREVYSRYNELSKAYLEPPHVTQLCQRLGYKDIFLTVDEFVNYNKKI